MTKLTLNTILSGFLSVTKMGQNFQDISDEFQNKVLYRDNPDGEPNQMENLIDMNSNRIINLLDATSSKEPVTLSQLNAASSLTISDASVTNYTPSATSTEETVKSYLDTEVFDTVSSMIAAGLNIGRVVATQGYLSATGGGGAEYKIVAGATGTDDGGSFIDLNNGNQAQLLVNKEVTFKMFGAAGDYDPTTGIGTDDTAAVQATIDFAGVSGVIREGTGDFKIVGDPAITIDQAYNFIDYDFGSATFWYDDGAGGGGIGTAIEIGGGDVGSFSRLWQARIRRLRVQRRFSIPYETGLKGKGIKFVNVGSGSFRDFLVTGFDEGYSFRPNAEGQAVTINSFYFLFSQACRVNVFMEPGDFDNCFVTSNKFFGGYHVTDQNSFTDVLTADAFLIHISNPFSARPGNGNNGNTFTSVTIEQSVTRKILCSGNANQFTACYFDAGSYINGGSHAAGIFPYRQGSIAGFTSNGTNVITKAGHGLLPFIIPGDMITLISAVDISDGFSYIATAIDANTITLNKTLAGTGSVTIGHFSTNIEFLNAGNNNTIIDCTGTDSQVIASGALIDNNAIFDGKMGVTGGPLPSFGPKVSVLNPQGTTDAAQETILNRVVNMVAGTGTANVVFGALNDSDTDGNIRLNGVGLDANDRLTAFGAIEFNKKGRNTSTAFGGGLLKSRENLANKDLIDAFEWDEDGNNISHGTMDMSTAGGYFGGNASNNLLTMFDEQNFTPLWTSAAGSGTVTYTTNGGSYSRVGNRVHFELTMRTSSIASRTGVVTLTGLPFAAAAGRDQSVYVGFAANLNIAAGEVLAGYVLGGSSTIKLQLWDSVVGQTPLDASEWSDDGFITVSGSYKV